MQDSWITRRHQELLSVRQPGPGWGNRPGGQPYVEPTALAALALAASDPQPEDAAQRSRAAIATAARWLVDMQRSDGALGISADLPKPRWTTPLAILAWSAAGGAAEHGRKAVAWLLSQ